MKRKTFLSRDKVLILGQSLMRVVKFHYHPPLKELTLFRIGNLKIVMPKAFVLILRFNPGMSSWKWKTPIDHFTVVCSVTWSLNGSEARGDLVLIQTSLLLLCKSSCSNAN